MDSPIVLSSLPVFVHVSDCGAVVAAKPVRQEDSVFYFEVPCWLISLAFSSLFFSFLLF